MLTLRDFFQFLRSPDEKPLEISGNMALLNVLFLFILTLPLSLLASLPANLWPDPQNHLVDMLAESLSHPSLEAVFFVALLGPFWEEIIFRYGLKASLRRVMTSGIFFLGYTSLSLGALPAMGVFGIILGILIPGFLAWALPRLFPGLDWDRPRLSFRGTKIFIWTVAFVFAQIHLLNYEILTPQGWGLAALLNLPRFFLALALTYVRFRLGTVWAGVLHITNNTFFLIIFTLLGAQGV